MGYPSEETSRRNRWQDEYDAQTRAMHQGGSFGAADYVSDYAWDATGYDNSDIPADIRADFEE